jgi:hypothetical protein
MGTDGEIGFTADLKNVGNLNRRTQRARREEMLRHFYFGNTQNQKFRNTASYERKALFGAVESVESACGEPVESACIFPNLKSTVAGFLCGVPAACKYRNLYFSS